VQPRDPGWLRTTLEALAEHLGKQRVITIPVALVVQRHYKQVGAFQLFKDELAVYL
jgi:hypothetical protein